MKAPSLPSPAVPGYTWPMGMHAARSSYIAGLLLLAASIPAFGASILTTTNPLTEIESSPQEERLVELTIESEPSGAQVTINGRPRGAAPITISNLPPGILLVEIAAEGFETTQLRLRLVGNEAVRVSIPLRRQSGTLRVVVDPPEAELLIDGERVDGLKETELPTGSYRLILRRFGYRAQERTVEVLPEESVTVEAVLEPAPFRVDLRHRGESIAIVASAPGAAVLMADDPTGEAVFRREVILTAEETEVSLRELPPGAYRFRLRARSASQGTVVLLSRDLVWEGPRAATGSGPAPLSLSQGLLFAPVARSAGESGFAIGSGWSYLPEAPGTGLPASVFSLASIIAVAPDTELLIGSTLFLSEDQEINRLGFTASAFWRFYDPGNFALGLQGRISADLPLGNERDYRPNLTGNPTGVVLSVPASLSLPVGAIAMSATFAPEAGFTWSPPSWNPESPGQVIDPATLVGVRGGFGAGVGPVFLAASGRLGWSLPETPDSGFPDAHFGVEARFQVADWATTIMPLFAFAGPWGNLEPMFGVSVTVGR